MKSVSNKNWKLSKYSQLEYTKIAESGNFDNPIIPLLLLNRGVLVGEIASFFDLRIKNNLKDPYLVKDMQKAVERIAKAIKQREKICLLSDYDVDGATAQACFYKYLSNFGIDVVTYVPDREKEGYGPSTTIMEKIYKKGAKLLIVMDTGSLALEAFEKAGELGLDSVIIDHHTIEINKPNALAIINPNRLDDDSNLENLAAVGLCFLVLVALNRHLREEGFFTKGLKEPNLIEYLDFVALGSVCDMVPLRGLNRSFVIQGLSILQKLGNKGIKALQQIKNEGKDINIGTIGFLFGPILNSGSRMGDSSLAFELLASKSEEEAFKLAQMLVHTNEQRKVLEDYVYGKAKAIIDKNNLLEQNIVLVGDESFAKGVVGIVAGRLKEEFNKTFLVYNIDEEGFCVGSARAGGNFHIGNMLIAARQRGLITKGGGHKKAGGFTFELSKITELAKFLNSVQEEEEEEFLIDSKIDFSMLDLDFVESLEKLEPFGIGFKEPVFLVENAVVQYFKEVGAAKNHIMCNVVDLSGKSISAFAFKAARSSIALALSKQDAPLSLVVSVDKSFYQGLYKINLKILDVIL